MVASLADAVRSDDIGAPHPLVAAAMPRERPELGHTVEDEDWRELLVPAGRITYVLRYRIDEDAVVIARVWPSREDR